jgi:hypothetical protein
MASSMLRTAAPRRAAAARSSSSGVSVELGRRECRPQVDVVEDLLLGAVFGEPNGSVVVHSP